MNIFDAINDGLHDDDLPAIIDAAKSRLRSSPIKVGQTVRVSDNCSPKYMQGIRCTVQSVHGAKQKTGEIVYLCKPIEEDAFKLYGTKMGTYSSSSGWSVKSIRMQRSLIEPVVAEVKM